MQEVKIFGYDELFVGQSANFSREVTNEMLESFRALSGDENPLHSDENFAKASGFKSRVVYGMLTASLYSCLTGVYLPGKYCFLHSVRADFLSPVFVGDILTCEAKIIEKRDLFQQIVIKAYIRNQDGKKVSRAIIEAGVKKKWGGVAREQIFIFGRVFGNMFGVYPAACVAG